MVYFEDMDTTFDVSMEDFESWNDSEEHSSIHSDVVRNFDLVENAGNVIVVTYERNVNGQWGKSRTRMTSFPPYCRVIEELEGEFAGSKFFGVHRPHGEKMKLDIFGDIQSKSMSGEQLRIYWLGVLAKSYDEDVASLKAFRSRVRTPGPKV